MKYYEDEQFDSSVLLWDEILDRCKNDEAYFYAGMSHYFCGNKEKCKELFERALHYNENSKDLYINLGIILHYEGQYDSAISLYSKALDLDTNCVLYFDRALAYLEIYDTTRAYSDLLNSHNYLGVHSDLVTKSDSSFSSQTIGFDIYYLLGEIAIEWDSMELAKKWLIMAQSYDSTNTKVINMIGSAEYLIGNHEIAKTLFDKSLQIDSDYYPAMQNLGMYYFKKKQWQIAESTLKDIPHDKLNADGFDLYSKSLYYNGNFQEARQINEKGLTLFPRDKSLIIGKGMILTSQLKYDSVLLWFNENKPITDYIEARELILNAIIFTSGPDNAMRYLRTQIIDNPEEEIWYFHMGFVYFRFSNLYPKSMAVDSISKYWKYFACNADLKLINEIDPENVFKLKDIKTLACNGDEILKIQID